MENKVEIPYDIIFLLKRLDIVISREEYEKAHIINKWIKELVTFYKVEEVYYLNF
jgi:protein-arginine kinase activator protein McsA